jgi:hypothetical protein
MFNFISLNHLNATLIIRMEVFYFTPIYISDFWGRKTKPMTCSGSQLRMVEETLHQGVAVIGRFLLTTACCVLSVRMATVDVNNSDKQL